MQLKPVLLHTEAIYTKTGFCVKTFFYAPGLFFLCFVGSGFLCLKQTNKKPPQKPKHTRWVHPYMQSTSRGFPPQLWPNFTLSLECHVKNGKVSYCSQIVIQKEAKLSKHWLFWRHVDCMFSKFCCLPSRKYNSVRDLLATFYLFLLLIRAGLVDRAS